METHSSILAWKISWTEEPGRLQSMGSQKVGHDLVTEQQHAFHGLMTCFCCCDCTTVYPFTYWRTSWLLSRYRVSRSVVRLCDPMDCSLPGSSVHGILQARILEQITISFSRGSSQPRDGTMPLFYPALTRGFFTTSGTWKPLMCK